VDCVAFGSPVVFDAAAECTVHIVTTKSVIQVTYPYATQVSLSSLDSLDLQTHTRPNAFLARNLQPDKNSSDILNRSVDSLFARECETIVLYQY
jgi:hypothetical protein